MSASLRPGRRKATAANKPVDQVEAVAVAAVEMDSDAGGTIEPGAERQRLAEAAVLSGAGDQHPATGDTDTSVGAKAKLRYIHGERA
jgi:hypothetical protein